MKLQTHKTRDEWLDAREGLLTASEAPTVMGLNPFESPLKLALRKTGQLPRKEESPVMKMGHVLQPLIRDLWEDEVGVKTKELGEYTLALSDEFPFAGATLDYLVPGSGDKGMFNASDAALECKNVGPWMMANWEEEVPLYVQVQLQFQLAVTGMSWGSVAALLSGQKFVFAHFERNDKFIKHMMVTVEAFVDDLKEGKLPEPQATDMEAILALYPEHEEGKIITLDNAAAKITQVIEEKKKTLKEEKEILGEAEAQLKVLIGDAERAVLPDGTGWSWKASERKYKATEARTIMVRTLRRTEA